MSVPKGVRYGGRQKGTPNKTTAELRDIARQYSEAAVHELARLGGLIKDEKGNAVGAAQQAATRVMALDKLLDRAHGRPTQPVASNEENPFEELMTWLDGKTRGIPSQQQDAQRNLS